MITWQHFQDGVQPTMMLPKQFLTLTGATVVTLLSAVSSQAANFGGVEFPKGAISFADRVVSYNPVIKHGNPISLVRDPSKALGSPDCGFFDLCSVSLGYGGSITLQFIDNFLTGSGNKALDLWIFETGPNVEDTFVDISKDGVTWHSVGKILGGTRGIDIDAFGWGRKDLFSFVRLTDDPNQGNRNRFSAIADIFAGADIDAVGAISSALREQPPAEKPPKSVPEPSGALSLFAVSVFALYLRNRKSGIYYSESI